MQLAIFRRGVKPGRLVLPHDLRRAPQKELLLAREEFYSYSAMWDEGGDVEEYPGEGTPTCCAQKLQSYRSPTGGCLPSIFQETKSAHGKCEQRLNIQLRLVNRAEGDSFHGDFGESWGSGDRQAHLAWARRGSTAADSHTSGLDVSYPVNILAHLSTLKQFPYRLPLKLERWNGKPRNIQKRTSNHPHRATWEKHYIGEVNKLQAGETISRTRMPAIY